MKRSEIVEKDAVKTNVSYLSIYFVNSMGKMKSNTSKKAKPVRV